LEGKLAEVQGVMFDERGEPCICKGGYIIVDGGYPKSQYLIDGTTHSWDVRTTVWSEWLESVRKDVECFFGIMKSRFRIFANAIQLHNFFDIECAWRSCIILHNMLIEYEKDKHISE
jgi:hypothetical protein